MQQWQSLTIGYTLGVLSVLLLLAIARCMRRKHATIYVDTQELAASPQAPAPAQPPEVYVVRYFTVGGWRYPEDMRDLDKLAKMV